MTLYTIMFEFRGHTYPFQVRAKSVKAGLRQWAGDLDAGPIHDFGELSRLRLRDELPRAEPTKHPDLVNVSVWRRTVSGYLATVYIIPTEVTPA